MEYRKGTVGRVFSVRFDEGDIFLEDLLDLHVEGTDHG